MRRIDSLQGLRGWAIFFIILWHLNPVFPGTLPRLGNLGVDFFLLLSGFLIARKVDSSDTLSDFRSSAAYMYRKLKNSYFLYLFPAVPVFLLDVFAGPVKPSAPFWRLLTYCTLTQSWVPASWIYWGVNSAGWFLPVILFCYLMTPVVRRVVRRFSALPVLIACLVLQIAAELSAEHFLSESLSDWLTYICPAYRILDFTLGFCAWHLFCERETGFSPCRALHTSRPIRQSTCAIPCYFIDLLYAMLVLILAGLLLVRPVLLKYVLFHPFEILLLLIVASEKSVLSNLLNRNRLIVRLGNLSRICFFTHVPFIRLTGMVWRRIFGPDLLFPQWVASLLVVFLSALIIDWLMKKYKKAVKKAP